MDRPLEKKRLSKAKLSAIAGLAVVGVVVLSTTIFGGNGRHFSPHSTPISVDRVRVGEFLEYVSIGGGILPDQSVYLDLEEGGIVENASDRGHPSIGELQASGLEHGLKPRTTQ